MITLCIHYVIDAHLRSDFEDYARRWTDIIPRCGGKLVGYYLPTKLAGATNTALALINFTDLAAYQKYRDALGKDPAAIENVARIDHSRCIISEERSFLEPVSG